MRTRVNTLREDGVGVARFYVNDGESFIFGRKPRWKESFHDDYVMTTDCRFMIKGAVLVEGSFSSLISKEGEDTPKRGNPYWSKMTAIGDSIGFCLGTTNPRHRVLGHCRIELQPGESKVFEVGTSGYIVSAVGNITVNEVDVTEMELVRLSGEQTVTVVAGDEGALIGLLEIEFQADDSTDSNE